MRTVLTAIMAGARWAERRHDSACHEAGAWYMLPRGEVKWALETVVQWARERGLGPDDTLRRVVTAGIRALEEEQ